MNMDRNARISQIQLAMLAMGFLFGGTSVTNPAVSAGRDAWMANLISQAGSAVLIGCYAHLAKTYPGKTLVEILRGLFGKALGSVAAVLYLWYTLHIAALSLRGATAFMTNTIYPETPDLFIAVAFILVTVYMVKKGIEVVARVSELLVPIFLVSAFTLFLSLVSLYEPANFLPVLEKGFAPVGKASFFMLTYPYGEAVVLLMIFPSLHKEGNLNKSLLAAILAAGLVFLMFSARDLMTLGPDMFQRATTANFLSAKLVPGLDIEALIAINLMIGSGIKISVCLYAASIGISQLFGLDDYKPFIIPNAAILVSLSIFLFESMIQLEIWGKEVYPVYAVFFQIIIPVFMLAISLVRKRRQSPSQPAA